MLNYSYNRLSSDLIVKLKEEVDHTLVSEIKVGKDFFYTINKSDHLIDLNKKIVDDLLSPIPLNNSAVGFVKEKSYLDLLEPHRKSSLFLRLDVSSFFHSIKITDISETIKPYLQPEYLDDEKKIKTVDRFVNAVTYQVPADSENIKLRGERVLPIGFPSSPILSNIIFRKIDIQIQKYCREENVTYTRYADDMLFSSNSKKLHSSFFIEKIRLYISQLSLRLNDIKTLATVGHISLNGYVIDSKNEKIRLSNSKLSKINKITHYLLTKKLSPQDTARKVYGYNIEQMKFKYGRSDDFFNQYCKDQLFNKIIGNRAHVISLIKYHEKIQCVCPNFIKKVEIIINRLNQIINAWE